MEYVDITRFGSVDSFNVNPLWRSYGIVGRIAFWAAIAPTIEQRNGMRKNKSEIDAVSIFTLVTVRTRQVYDPFSSSFYQSISMQYFTTRR